MQKIKNKIKLAENHKEGREMYYWLSDLFPINRSLTGEGVRFTLNYIKNIIPELQIFSIESGKTVFDWVVPDEWHVEDAYIKDSKGIKIVDFKDNNLHLVGYSIPFEGLLELNELNNYLHSIKDFPDAIPYLTSYYNKKWGFCITENQRQKLLDGKYEVVIKSKLFKGILNYGELILKGREEKEILLSTYICHPSMANNELSGPVVTMELFQWLSKLKNRKYTYRFLFLPETIGPIAYLSVNDNLEKLKANVIAGFQITCVGDDNNVDYLESKYGNKYIDRVIQHFLKYSFLSYRLFKFTQRGSDERQWSSPNVDLPIASLMRSKYHEFREYHTSKDNLDFVSEKGLYGGFVNIKTCLEIFELDEIYKCVIHGEPFLSKRIQFNYISNRTDMHSERFGLMNVLTYMDGNNSILDIADILEMDFFEVHEIAQNLLKMAIIEKFNA